MRGLTRRWGDLRRYKKVFLSYISMIAFPFLVASILFILIHILMMNQIESIGETKAQHFESKVTSLFREVEIITDSIANDSAISRYLSSPNQPQGNKLTFCDDLRRYAGQSAFISTIYVVGAEGNHILSSQGLYTSGSLDSILAKIGETQDSFSQEADAEGGPGWHIGSKGIVEPYYIAPIYAADTGRKAADIIVVMYTSALYNILAEEEVALCCLFDENRYISSIGSDINDINWYSDAEMSGLLGQEVKCFFTGSDDFVYMVAIPTASFYAPSRVIILCFLVFFIGVSVVGVLQAGRVSRRNYQAISKIIEKLPGTLKQDPSYEEIADELEQALIRYRDNVDRLNLEVQSNSLSWILGGYLTQPVSSKNLADAGISALCAGFHVATFFTRDYSDMFFDSRSETENRDIALVIFRSALSSVAGTRAVVSCCRIRGNIAAVFCHSSRDDSDQTATSILHETADLIERNYGLNIHVALSGWIEDPSQLSVAYNQTHEVAGFASAVDIDTRFISHSGLIKGGEFRYGISYLKQIQIMINTLLLGKYDVVPQMVETLLDKEVSPLSGNYSLGKSRISCIAGLLSEAVMASEESSLDRSECASRLRTADSISKLTETAADVFQGLNHLSNTLPNTSVVDRACAYIREHLQDPNMSIPEICAAVDISVQHLSRLFRKQLNRTVAEYVNESRVNWAKELLVDKKLTVSKVSQAVGYGSNDAFYRNFKKVVGLTPAEYVRMVSDYSR